MNICSRFVLALAASGFASPRGSVKKEMWYDLDEVIIRPVQGK